VLKCDQYQCNEIATVIGFPKTLAWTPQEFIALCDAHAPIAERRSHLPAENVVEVSLPADVDL
jgi:hypothetical protein